MKKVYFKPIDSYSKTEEISTAAAELLKKLIENENLTLEKFVPLKVHFGEKGNKTFIESKNYEGVINYLKAKNIESAFIETNVLYIGERTTREKHMNLAREHGFTQLPVIIADGEHGEEYENIFINKKNFVKCKVAGEIAKQKQIIVLSHFKGHILAGFGGAVKQLGMGCASRGGKLDQHANSKPRVSFLKCKGCSACAKNCPENAIIVDRRAKINKEKCVGCASCIAVCPQRAITHSWISAIPRAFNERLAEYAYAASQNKKNIYISFALNITKGCDCEGHNMKKISNDIGVFASTDPVAIDKACLDMLDKINGRTVFKRGRYTLDYGEKIGLGTTNYELVEIK